MFFKKIKEFSSLHRMILCLFRNFEQILNPLFRPLCQKSPIYLRSAIKSRVKKGRNIVPIVFGRLGQY